MWQLFIVTFFESWKIQFDSFWFIFIHFYPFLSNFIPFHPLWAALVFLGQFQTTIEWFWTLKPISRWDGMLMLRKCCKTNIISCLVCAKSIRNHKKRSHGTICELIWHIIRICKDNQQFCIHRAKNHLIFSYRLVGHGNHLPWSWWRWWTYFSTFTIGRWSNFSITSMSIKCLARCRTILYCVKLYFSTSNY